MSDEIRVSRPPMQAPMATQQPQPEMMQPKSGKTAWVVLGVIVLVLIVVGFMFRSKLFAGKNMAARILLPQPWPTPAVTRLFS